MAHPWAERAQRQRPYGVVMTDELADLKSEAGTSRLECQMVSVPIVPPDRDRFKATYQELLRESDDPSAGFLRFLITEYVEAFGKLSPMLTEWLLEHVPSPLRYRVEALRRA